MQGTPKSKLNENDAISQNYEVVNKDGSVMGYGKENSVRTPNESVEVRGDDEKNHDGDYDPIEDRVENADNELHNEAFDDYQTDESEFQHNPAPSDESEFEEHVSQKRKVILDDQDCDHTKIEFRVGLRGKWKALNILRGSLQKHYELLKPYMAELLKADKEGSGKDGND
ncbi:hypothetical protein GH714_021169 [Hevea brasiliensis]|uniref:Uncharacterized protein n=1 Tax=Hevea brasiliensis TaxID=3981 RepID=A0A6A6NDI0_HEVBR|nr:hypothetical protein GH714_021169 [Hevea brasiliensis]